MGFLFAYVEKGRWSVICGTKTRDFGKKQKKKKKQMFIRIFEGV